VKRITLVVLGVVVLAGCGVAHRSVTPFQARANAICARINTSPFLDTKSRYDADLRRTALGLRQLSSLGASAPNLREFGDLVGSMRAIYAFDRAHESQWVALAQVGKRVDARMMRGLRPRWPKDQQRFMAMVSRQTGGYEDEKFHNAKALGLNACNEVSSVASLRLRRTG
jgi:hypothetical protein